jgi:hypothetical protein
LAACGTGVLSARQSLYLYYTKNLNFMQMFFQRLFFNVKPIKKERYGPAGIKLVKSTLSVFVVPIAFGLIMIEKLGISTFSVSNSKLLLEIWG